MNTYAHDLGGPDKAVYFYPEEHYDQWLHNVPRHADQLRPISLLLPAPAPYELVAPAQIVRAARSGLSRRGTNSMTGAEHGFVITE